jgi:hypothetical protein
VRLSGVGVRRDEIKVAAQDDLVTDLLDRGRRVGNVQRQGLSPDP